jgi:menaquinone-dependent protoporphyrinogen oxidase
MKLLVVYGSKRLGTAGIAETLAAEFHEQGVEVDVRPARLAGEIDGYQAVIVGGALYSNRWHRDAFRFVRPEHSGVDQASGVARRHSQRAHHVTASLALEIVSRSLL